MKCQSFPSDAAHIVFGTAYMRTHAPSANCGRINIRRFRVLAARSVPQSRKHKPNCKREKDRRTWSTWSHDRQKIWIICLRRLRINRRTLRSWIHPYFESLAANRIESSLRWDRYRFARVRWLNCCKNWSRPCLYCPKCRWVRFLPTKSRNSKSSSAKMLIRVF